LVVVGGGSEGGKREVRGGERERVEGGRRKRGKESSGKKKHLSPCPRRAVKAPLSRRSLLPSLSFPVAVGSRSSGGAVGAGSLPLLLLLVVHGLFDWEERDSLSSFFSVLLSSSARSLCCCCCCFYASEPVLRGSVQQLQREREGAAQREERKKE